MASAAADLTRLESELALQRVDLAGERAALAGAAAADENASRLILTAAEAGTVTGILVNRGDAVAPDRPLLSIVPRGTRLRAHLEIPPAATGLVAPGQEMRIAVDAFPYATYGTVEARIDTVSAATVPVARSVASPSGLLAARSMVVRSISADAIWLAIVRFQISS